MYVKHTLQYRHAPANHYIEYIAKSNTSRRPFMRNSFCVGGACECVFPSRGKYLWSSNKVYAKILGKFPILKVFFFNFQTIFVLNFSNLFVFLLNILIRLINV